MQKVSTSRVALVSARWAGRAMRALVPLIDALPGVIGVGLVAYGLGLAWLPLGFVALGAALIVIDWRRA